MCGMTELPHDPNPKRLSLDDIRRLNWSEDYDRLRKNRMVQGFFRYGELGKQGMIDRAGYIIKKAEQYQKTGNLECLVDIGNVAMAEFVESNHPNAHFKALDDKDHGTIQNH
jgi:hypothetical protein